MQLHRLAARFPEQQLAFDRVEFFESALYATRRIEDFVNVGRCNTVGHEGDFQVALGTLAQCAFARESLGIEKVAPTFGRTAGLAGVVAQHEVVDRAAHTAFADRAGDVVVFAANTFEVHRDEKPFTATQL